MIRFVALFVAAFAVVACVPAAASESSGTGSRDASLEAAPTPAVVADPQTNARRVLEDQFAASGWVESITSLVFHDGLLQVTLDRPTATLGEVEVYARMCNVLSSLIASDENPSPVQGVQFYRANGAAVVASGSASTPCSRFYR